MGVKTAIITAAANTATGTQDFTKAGFGTPKAAIFLATRGITDATIADHQVHSHGACDGVNAFVVGGRSRHSQGNSDTDRRGATDAVIMLLNEGDTNVDGEASFDSWITDGVRIDWTNAPAGAYLVTVILFGGDDLSAKCGTATAVSPDGKTTDVDVGFVPDVVLFFCNGTSLNDTTSWSNPHNFGFAINKAAIVNRGLAAVSGDNLSTTHTRSRVHDNLAVVNLNPADNTLSRGIEVTDFINTPVNGFEMTLRVGDGPFSLTTAYLALKFDGAVDFSAFTIDTPVATGNQSISTPGFKPQLVILGTSQCTAVNSSTDGFAAGVSCFTANDEASKAGSDENNVGTTVTKSLSDERAGVSLLDTGSVGHVASFSSMDANGWTWNFSTTQAAARKWIALAIEEEAAAGPNVSDSLTVGDTPTVSVEAAPVTDLDASASDGATVGESVSLTLPEVGAFTIGVSDALALADTPALTVSDSALSVSDSLTVGDHPSVDAGEPPPPDLGIAITPDSVFVRGVRIWG
jgi:hypothetical protein